jgi:membrane protein implicated in regulation of membrane protease activity
MLSLYLGSVVFGGVLLAASAIGGHGDGDANGTDHGGDGTNGHAAGDGSAHDATAAHQGARLPFFSLRFWAFATAFFGLAGGALTVVGGLGALTPLVAGAVGLGCGGLSARVLGRLGQRPLGLIASADAHVGREGRVLLPVGPGQRGKIRLSIAGVSTDLVAETDGANALRPGESALVVGLRDNVALVEPNPAGQREENKS